MQYRALTCPDEQEGDTAIGYIAEKRGCAWQPGLGQGAYLSGGDKDHVDSAKNQMSIAQASEFAQALLVGIQIADKLNNVQAVQASVEYDATGGTQ
jgi:hypothetical protein